MIDTHCLPNGSLGTGELPVPPVNAACTSSMIPSAGLGVGAIRGVIVSLHGLGDTPIPPGVPSGTSIYGEDDILPFGNSVVGDGWILLVGSLPCDWYAGGPSVIGQQNDIANDTGGGARYLASLLHWWDHMVNYIHTTYGNMPIVPMGVSMGGWSCLQIVANRASTLTGYMCQCPATIISNIGPTFWLPAVVAGLNTTGMDISPTQLNSTTIPGIVGYGTADEAVGYGGNTTVASGSNGVAASSVSTLHVASSSNFLASGSLVQVQGLTGGTGSAWYEINGTGTGTLTGCSLFAGSGTLTTGCVVVQSQILSVISNGQGAGSPITVNATTDIHGFTGTSAAHSYTAVSGTLNQTGSPLNVNKSTSGETTTGVMYLTHNGGTYAVSYTNISGSTFTGCTIASGTITVTNGDAVVAHSDAAIFAAYVTSTLDPLCPKAF